MPHFIALLLLLACSCGAWAQSDVALIGVIGDKAAVVAIDGGDPVTIRAGQTRSGITVVSVDRTSATIEVRGAKRVLSLGQHHRATAAAPTGQSVTLAADTAGHFLAEGQVNGGPVRFVVDTGATVVALPAADARRLNIDYRKGKVGQTRTANGTVPVYVVTLERVKVGAIELSSVEGIVIEQGLDVALLGMSFLSRVNMRHDGQTLTLQRRF
ncbi:MAG TPA: TIGR02281 family clan AA aspartic protease [Burkholderiales bacterium]|jgi:aspartyl protease family protein